MAEQSLEASLDQYARLIVKVGLNLQPGQRLLMNGRNMHLGVSLAAVPLVRAVARHAYQAGAALVDVFWADDEVSLIRHQHAPRDSFEQYPQWRAKGLLEIMEKADASLTIIAEDPYLLVNAEPALVTLEMQTTMRHNQPSGNLRRVNFSNWSVVGAASPGWAARVFPEAPPEEQVNLLWQALFRTCRVDLADPVAAWQEHLDNLVERSAYLNGRRYSGLHFKAEGTDLLLGLPEGHLWDSARFVSSSRQANFTANMPTEEIFSLPHRDKVEGFISASRPMVYGGIVIEGLGLRFEGGKVVNASARTGEKALNQLLDSDEGARRLGEVALVPDSSPISKMNILFHNTLLDENAASHIALGSAYRFSLEGGSQMDSKRFMAAGGNESLIHADFMIGTAAMAVDGLLANGDREALMRDGEWVY